MKTGFVLEYSLGHVTHADNLKRVLEADHDLHPSYIDLPKHNMAGAWKRHPIVRGEWWAEAAMGAYVKLKPQIKALNGVFFHTQTTSLFSTELVRRKPVVVSLDSTLVQLDTFAELYGIRMDGRKRFLKSRLRRVLDRRAIASAQHLVSWSQWAKDSLVKDYAVQADKITVIPPGVDVNLWQFPQRPVHNDRTVNLLFVGAAFARKGGHTLLEAFQALPKNVNAHLHIVTKTEVVGDGHPNVTVYRDLSANSDRLRQLFAEADVFTFPTQGDCLPLAVMEALAAGLPVVTSDVGALPEAVTHGETGLVVPPNDAVALKDALTMLISDVALRVRMGANARETALCRFDGARNYQRLAAVIKQVVQ